MRLFIRKSIVSTDSSHSKNVPFLGIEGIDTAIPYSDQCEVHVGLENMDARPSSTGTPILKARCNENGLISHAKRELHVLGLDNDGSDGMNKMMYNNIMEMIETFSKQGHSGFSANYAIAILTKLLSYKPLCPLTGNDDEWVEIADTKEGPLYQNNRCCGVFKNGKDGAAYFIDGIVWKEENGACYTNRHSRVPVTFPYTPSTEYKPASEDPGRNE